MKTTHFKIKTMKTGLCLLLLMYALAFFPQQYLLDLPSVSQAAEVRQRIGITDIVIKYHSPGVKGRMIFGTVVPYGKVWRAGANHNTTISFAHEVSIQGQRIPAGTYGLHMIPEKDEFTIIFSTNSWAWGSEFYDKAEDQLRVKVKQRAHEFTEWLTYSFTDKADESVTLSLMWDKTEVPVKIDVDMKHIVVEDLKKQLQSNLSAYWQAWYEAAVFTVQYQTDYEQGLKWVNVANQFQPGNFRVLSLKSTLLDKTGNAPQAKAVMQAAISSGTENDLNAYGYELINAGKLNDAIEVFKLNVKKHRDSWNAYDSLGEALVIAGNKKEAAGQYAMALKTAPESQKKRIEAVLKELK